MIEKMQNYYRLNHKLKDVLNVCDKLEEAKEKDLEVDRDLLYQIAENIPDVYDECHEYIDIGRRDLAHRIKRRRTIIVLVLLWPILAITGALITKFLTGESWILLATFIYPAFMIGTYSLCWVGFPIGWNKIRDMADGAGGAIINLVALFVGLITMSLSYFIAIGQIFTEKRNMSYIRYTLDLLDKTLKQTKSMEHIVSERLAY